LTFYLIYAIIRSIKNSEPAVLAWCQDEGPAIKRTEQEIKLLRGGAGILSRFWDELTKAIEALGGNADDLYKLGTDEGKPIISEIAKLIVGRAEKVAGDIYKAVVDYSMSLAEMIAAGNYDWVNSDITAKNFPFSGEGKVEVEYVLVHLNRTASTEDVLAEFARLGLEAPNIAEFLAFGTKYPDLQRQFPIICLGSVWRVDGGGRRVPSLRSRGGDRRLHLNDYGRDWGDACRFLAVRKSA